MKLSQRSGIPSGWSALSAMVSRIAVLLFISFSLHAALRAQVIYATPFTFTTFAGASSAGSIDGTGSVARFTHPSGVAADSSGNIYVADSNAIVRKITSGGVVTTLAGLAGSQGTSDGTGSAARFTGPGGVAVDGSGNIYVADTAAHSIRKITAAGVVTTFAGTVGVTGATDGIGTAAKFNYPRGLAVDNAGNIYVADSSNCTIRKITSGGVVTTLAGAPNTYGPVVDGTGSAARFFVPNGVAVDGAGNVYVADSLNNAIRKITAAGEVTTLAGSFAPGWTDGTGSDARFNYPIGVVVDGTGNVYVSDSGNYTIRKVTSAGVVTTIAGNLHQSGSVDGPGATAQFVGPGGVGLDSFGDLYVADTGGNTIRKITAGLVVSTLAGSSPFAGVDGPSSVAQFYSPNGVAVDGSGNVYVADRYECTIRKIAADGMVTTLAGLKGVSGSTDGAGSFARFGGPRGVVADATGNVYVADGNTIRKVNGAGVVTTLAGSAANTGSTDGTGTGAKFNGASGVAVDADGYVYVADSINNAIRKITPAGVVTTLAGMAGSLGSLDGTGSAARFGQPAAVAIDASGNIFVADGLNNSIRKVTPAGVVTTVAGGPGGSATVIDGTGTAAHFYAPQGLAVDTRGNLYVADTDNQSIRKITPAGVVTTLGGSGDNSITGLVDGTGSVARFNRPYGIAVDAAGDVYVADTMNNNIRKGVPAITASITTASDFDGDAKSDIFWSNTSTGDRAIWFMNGTAVVTNAFAGTVPAAWTISGTGDFDGDGKGDIFWTNTATGDRAMWLMNGSAISSGAYLGSIPVDWVVSGTGDFNRDGKSDVLWTNTTTGERSVWLMNGGVASSGASLGVVPVAWVVSGTGDFNGDGKSDILLSNTVTGDRVIWMMDGTVIGTNSFAGTVPVAWIVSGTGDFDGDGKADIFWTNTATGDRAVWLMNGNTNSTGGYLGAIPVEWVVSKAAADYNGDGKADILWTNTTTGERAIWLMNGITTSGGASLGVVPVAWTAAN